MALSIKNIWAQLVEKDHKLAHSDHKITFTAANLKRLLQQVYNQGAKMGVGVQDTTLDSLFKAKSNSNITDQMNDILRKDF